MKTKKEEKIRGQKKSEAQTQATNAKPLSPAAQLKADLASGKITPPAETDEETSLLALYAELLGCQPEDVHTTIEKNRLAAQSNGTAPKDCRRDKIGFKQNCVSHGIAQFAKELADAGTPMFGYNDTHEQHGTPSCTTYLRKRGISGDNTQSQPCGRLVYAGILKRVGRGLVAAADTYIPVSSSKSKRENDSIIKVSRQPPPSGAGFGSLEENKKVEEAAVDFVKQKYVDGGWEVSSVENEKCGYDLECHKDGTTENVEVKGISGTEQSFIITAGEVCQARTNPLFVLAVVTSALSQPPVLTRYSGRDFFDRFELKALQYRAVLRSATRGKNTGQGSHLKT